MTPTVKVLQGDCRDVLKGLPDESVQCVVTSPPYFRQRNYLPTENPDKALEIGREDSKETRDEYIESMVQVFRSVWRVLKKDGTLWIVIGDKIVNRQMMAVPWRLGLALEDDGWNLLPEHIWSKPNPQRESATNRCTRSHEYILFLSKSSDYYFDHEAIRTPPSEAMLKQIAEGYDGEATKLFDVAKVQDASATKARIINGKRAKVDKVRGSTRVHQGFRDRWDHLTREEQMACGSNKLSVWTVSAAPFDDDHFATFPPDLIRPCILAGSRPGDTVLDPFGGSGTTGQVALEYGRHAILIELNPEYIPMIERRTNQPGLILT